MPLTVITVKNVPPSLRGDLTKWMQEIATGVYVGNFNTKVREQLWERVQDSVGKGEATISFAYRNEIGYQFDTLNAQRSVIDFDGIPLVQLPQSQGLANKKSSTGFSDAAKFRKIKKFTSSPQKDLKSPTRYVVIDIETDGLDESENSIIEIGAVKVTSSQIEEFNHLIQYEGVLPNGITQLTGITQELLNREGKDIQAVLSDFLTFIGSDDLVGYGINLDVKFINQKLKELGLPLLTNRTFDLLKFAKNEKLFLDNYKLQTVLRAYQIEGNVPHRALQDSKLIYELSTKVNKFLEKVNQK